jgi:hypothetical protein
MFLSFLFLTTGVVPMSKLKLISLAIGALALHCSTLHAYGGDVEVIDEVLCESVKGRTAYCDIDTRGDVVLAQQHSRSQCAEGHSWGVDRQGLWVNQGCRGTFQSVVQRRRQPRYAPPPPPPEEDAVIRCESFDQRQAYCALPFPGRVRLANQLSRAECTQGYSWGYDRRGVWVSRGCRGEFVVY